MNRSYDKHGTCTLQRRQRRRRNGPLDLRTVAARNAESLAAQVIADKGGQDASAVTLVTIELVKRDIAWLHEVDKGIEDFKKAHPEVRRNPRALSKIYSYRQPMANALAKNLGMLGPDKVVPKTQSLEDYIAEKYAAADEEAEDGEEKAEAGT